MTKGERNSRLRLLQSPLYQNQLLKCTALSRYLITVFVRINAAALIRFFASNMRRLFEGGAYLKKETKHFLF